MILILININKPKSYTIHLEVRFVCEQCNRTNQNATRLLSSDKVITNSHYPYVAPSRRTTCRITGLPLAIEDPLSTSLIYPLPIYPPILLHQLMCSLLLHQRICLHPPLCLSTSSLPHPLYFPPLTNVSTFSLHERPHQHKAWSRHAH